MRPPTGSIVGTFSKAIDGGLSVNFGLSGGVDCDPRCRHHPASIADNPTHACYAVRAEVRHDRQQLRAKLVRHQEMPAALVCGKALAEIQHLVSRGKVIPWLRFSTNGSLPQPSAVRGNKLFRTQFRALLSFCRDNGIPVHIPVETYEKARFYRCVAGSLATIRESAQTTKRFLAASGAVSTVAGSKAMSRIERVESARQIASARREKSGRKVGVCPAVMNSFAARRNPALANPRAKCGVCTMCSDATCDVVFPLH